MPKPALKILLAAPRGFCAGVVRASRCELAGVMGPYPSPIRKAPSAMAASDGTAHSASPAAQSTSPAWLTRMAPQRATAVPPARLAAMAPA